MTEGFTAFFRCDIRKIKENPHHIETPFGKATIIGVGDIFTERDNLEETKNELYEALDGLVSNRNAYGSIDESWWEAANEALAKARGEHSETAGTEG